MSLIFRLAGRGLGSTQLLKQDCNRLINYARPVTIKCTKAVAPKNESYDEHNLRLRRPQSPHLTIYKFPLPAVLSISHRATGMILSAYVIAFSMAGLYLQCPMEYYIEQIKCAELGAGPIFAIKYLLALPLTYHFWNGVRHLIWDTGKFLTIKAVNATGWVMLVLAIASAVALSGLT